MKIELTEEVSNFLANFSKKISNRNKRFGIICKRAVEAGYFEGSSVNKELISELIEYSEVKEYKSSVDILIFILNLMSI